METLLEAEGIRVLRSSQATRVSMRDGKVQFDLIRTPRGAYEGEPTQVVAMFLDFACPETPTRRSKNAAQAFGVKGTGVAPQLI